MFKAVLRCCCLQLFWQRGKVHLVLGTEGCTHCYIKQAVFRADTFDIQNTVKGIARQLIKVSGPPRYNTLPLMGRRTSI